MNAEIQIIKKLKIVILSSFGHNGLDWLHSLLDNHPQALLMPAISFYRTCDFYRIQKGVNIFDLQTSLMADEFVSFIYKNSSYEQVRRKFLNSDQDAREFKKHLNDFLLNSGLQNNEENLFRGIQYAFCCLYNLEFKSLKILLAQEHVPWHSEKYIKNLDAKFVFIVRDPRAAIAGSWKRQQENAGLNKLDALHFDKINFYWFYSYDFYKKYLPQNIIKIMINERMHLDLEAEISQLCDWLDIEFLPVCLEQSFMGIEWLGESTYLAVDELSEKPPEDFYLPENIEKRWRSRLSIKDIQMIESIFDQIFIDFNYEFDTPTTYSKKIQGLLRYFRFHYVPNQDTPKHKIIMAVCRNILRRFFLIIIPLKVMKFFRTV
jgi:hypothetical protein